MNSQFSGINPAFYACYDESGNVSAERTEALALHLLKEGVQGLYVGGSSGECIYLDVDERMKTIEAVMRAVGGKMKVICHVACNNTRDSQKLAAHAESLGVDAIAAIPPIYFHLPADAIAAYWNDISTAAPKTPFIIYNIPQLAGVALTLPLLKKMLQNPNVIGVKNSSMPTQDIQIFKTAGGPSFTDAAMPRLFLKAEQLLQKGDFAGAQRVQYQVNDIITALCSGKGNMYAVIKGVLAARCGVECGGVRKPLMNLTDADKQVVAHCCELIDAAYAREELA